MLHVKYVARRGQAIRNHPKQSQWSDRYVMRRSKNGTSQHDGKCCNGEILGSISVEKVITRSCASICHVFEDSHHWYWVGLKWRHARKEHEAKENIDRCPRFQNSHCERRIINEFAIATTLYKQNSSDCLKYNKQHIQAAVNKVIVTKSKSPKEDKVYGQHLGLVNNWNIQENWHICLDHKSKLTCSPAICWRGSY